VHLSVLSELNCDDIVWISFPSFSYKLPSDGTSEVILSDVNFAFKRLLYLKKGYVHQYNLSSKYPLTESNALSFRGKLLSLLEKMKVFIFAEDSS